MVTGAMMSLPFSTVWPNPPESAPMLVSSPMVSRSKMAKSSGAEMDVAPDFRAHQPEINVQQRRAREVGDRHRRLDGGHKPPAQIVRAPQRIRAGAIPPDHQPFDDDGRKQHQRIKNDENGQRAENGFVIIIIILDHPGVGQKWREPLQREETQDGGRWRRIARSRRENASTTEWNLARRPLAALRLGGFLQIARPVFRWWDADKCRASKAIETAAPWSFGNHSRRQQRVSAKVEKKNRRARKPESGRTFCPTAAMRCSSFVRGATSSGRDCAAR